MIPILAAAAVSTIGDIYQNLTTKAASAPAQSAPQPTSGVNFSTLINPSAAPNSTQAIASAQWKQHTAELTSHLLHSADVTSAVNASGASGAMQIQLSSSGDATLHSSDGKVTPIHFSNEMRGVAQELYQAKAASQGVSASGTGTVVISAA
jgi:hypothetical protein